MMMLMAVSGLDAMQPPNSKMDLSSRENDINLQVRQTSNSRDRQI